MKDVNQGAAWIFKTKAQQDKHLDYQTCTKTFPNKNKLWTDNCIISETFQFETISKIEMMKQTNWTDIVRHFSHCFETCFRRFNKIKQMS